uniref:hypothetical protein n=1 Tax=Brachyspira catarrhinii TaxID=2528966 RepID=UPI003F4C72E9
MPNFFIPENKGTDPTGRFLDRNTNAGIFGAVIYAMILNQLGDESEALVKAAGLTPSSEDTTQWLQAIRKLYGDADTALKEELISKIEALTASDIAFDDSISISAFDVQEAINALHTLIKELKAKDITIDNIDGITASNVQELGEALNEKIDKEVEIIVDEKIPDIYDYSGSETLTNGIAKFADGSTKPIYRKIFQNKNFNFIKDNQYHFVAIHKFDINVTRVSSSLGLHIETRGDKPEWSYQFFEGNEIIRATFPKNYVGLDYRLIPEEGVTGYTYIYEYYKDDE